MTPPDAVVLPSPGLVSGQDGPPAYELKFLLSEPQAQAVQAWAGARMTLDPHADPVFGHAYQITSLYCDTALFDVYQRVAPHRRRKFRLRRYGREALVYLERKTKWGQRVAKRRTTVPDADLALLAEAEVPPTWPGLWFHERIATHVLRPACLVRYLRTAFVGRSADGPLRLTLDRGLRCVLADEWQVGDAEAGTPLLAGSVICELKFHTALPLLFKELIATQRLTPARVSKYRLAMHVCGGLPAESNGHA